MALLACTAGAALWLWTQGQVSVGAVAAATAMALRLNGISHWIMWELASLFEHVGTVQDGINTLARRHTVVDRAGAEPLQVPRGEIRFEHVRFAYGGERSVIEDFSLTIQAGEKIGLVGRSGAGKSTIVNLLLRFYDVEGGRILIDGLDIAGVTQTSLRAQVGMVTQDTSLLHRSVRDNIVYGRPDSTDEQMVAAARRAEAHEFVLGLSDPKGRQGYGSKWTSDIREAKFYPNASTAKGQATFFANMWPKHGMPDVVVFTAIEAGVLTEETKASDWRPT
jgi:ATP-binding cassette subfamily B multidrug efflux pump